MLNLLQMTSQHFTPKDRNAMPISEPARQMLQTVLYFEVFSYPMTFSEICQLSNTNGTSAAVLQTDLESLIHRGCLYKIKDFYLTKNEPDWVRQREANNQRADAFVKKAHWVSRLIMAFPFVRAVFVSGSLSKHVMPEDGDIDFFIITEPRRLWIARTFLILFKKIILFNSHKYFCVNYFIDEQNLEIEEKNRFTATEVVTLLPLYGKGLYDRFYAANQWVRQYYPHFPKRPTETLKNEKGSWLKKGLEWSLSGRLGNWMDFWFMKNTINYWNRKFKVLNPNDFAVALKSRQYVSKHHPSNFQRKVLEAHQLLMEEFEQRHRVRLLNQ